jgi:hypothetical protein
MLVHAVVDDLKVSEIYEQERDRCIERTCNVLGSAVEEPAFRPAFGAFPTRGFSPGARSSWNRPVASVLGAPGNLR